MAMDVVAEGPALVLKFSEWTATDSIYRPTATSPTRRNNKDGFEVVRYYERVVSQSYRLTLQLR